MSVPRFGVAGRVFGRSGLTTGVHCGALEDEAGGVHGGGREVVGVLGVGAAAGGVQGAGACVVCEVCHQGGLD